MGSIFTLLYILLFPRIIKKATKGGVAIFLKDNRIGKALMTGSMAIAFAIILSCKTYASDMGPIRNHDYSSVGLILPEKVIFLEIEDYINEGTDIFLIDYDALRRILLGEAKNNIEMKEPSLNLIDDSKRYEIERGQIGISLLIDETMRSLKKVIAHGLSSEIKVDYRVLPEYEYIHPKKGIGYYDFLENNVISEFSTEFGIYDKNRVENLRVSTAAIDGYIIMPGEEFSLGETLGPRTYSKGYKDAGIFANGKKSTGIAGGICQTSSTLFNAFMLSDMRLVERHRHSLPVPYLPRGRDAAISSRQDLKIINDSPYPIRIRSWIDDIDGVLFVEIYGKRKTRIELETIKSHEGGRNVYKTYKRYLNEIGDTIHRNLILTDVI